EREPAGQTLGSDDDVGAGPGVFVAPEGSGASETGLYFVGDQEEPVLVGALAQTLHECVRHRHVPALTEYRLDEDRGGVLGRGRGGELVVELAEGVGD